MALWFFPLVCFYSFKNFISKRMQLAAILILVLAWLVGISWSDLRVHLLLPQDVQTLASRMSSEGSSSVRKIYWLSALDAMTKSPVAGYGFLQMGMVQWTTALNYPSTGTFFNSAHMLPMDLAIWFGVPVAGLLFVALCRNIWLALKRCCNDAMFYVVAVIGVIFTHAMLEAPHLYMYFLLPAGVFLGIAGGTGVRHGAVGRVADRYANWLSVLEKIIILFSIAIGFFIAMDYFDLEKKWERLRFVEANFIVENSTDDSREELFLTNLQALYEALSSSQQFTSSAIKLNELRNVAIRYPLAANLRRYAVALAYAGEYDEAERVMIRMRKMHSTQVCELNKAWWYGKGLLENPVLTNVRFSCNDAE